MISKKESKIAFIWGNGESRKKVDHMYNGFLEDLRMIGEFYGCNAIYRDLRMDHLVLVDPEMLKEISTHPSKYADKFPVWTGYRNPKQWGTKIKNIPRNRRWNAGTLATHLAVQHENNEIYLIGHDLESMANGLTNNCYKSTDNYRKVFEDDITYDRFLQDWLEMLTECNGVNFYRVKSDSGFIPKELRRCAIKHITWNSFISKMKAYKKSMIFK